MIVDRNRLQYDGETTEVLNTNSLAEKFKAFGFEVAEVDGHDCEALAKVFSDAWDYQWAFARTLLDSYSIVSTVNQMSNIGFGEESTHTPNLNDRRGNMIIYKCHPPL